MNVALIGTNGFLSNQIGAYCNNNGIDVCCYGMEAPTAHSFKSFEAVNLVCGKVSASTLAQNDVVIYTSGAGIQSNLNEPWSLIYKLNTLVPIELSASLSDVGFQGTLVTFGSCFEIGNNGEDRLFDEQEVSTSLLEMPNHYCMSKRLLTRFVSSSFAKFNHLHIILPTIYGHGEAPHRIIPYTVNALKNNLPLQFTSGHQIRQYLYAGDIPAILFDTIATKTGGLINLPGVETYSIRQLVEIIYRYFEKTPSEDIFGTAERYDVGMQNLQLNGGKLSALVNHTVYTPITEALKQYDKYY